MGDIYWSCCLNATSLSPLATAKALGLDIPPTMLALTSDGADGHGVGRSGEKPGPSAQRFVNGSDTICSSGFGVTAIYPTNGRSCAALPCQKKLPCCRVAFCIHLRTWAPFSTAGFARMAERADCLCVSQEVSHDDCRVWIRSRHSEHLRRMIGSQREFLPPAGYLERLL